MIRPQTNQEMGAGVSKDVARSRPSTEEKAASQKPRLGSKALLASIVDSSDDAIISKTLEGIITSWNRGAERIYGYSAKEILGRSILTLVPLDRAGEIPVILEKIRRGEYVHHFKSERISKDGRTLKVSVTISPIRDASGGIVGASTIARDITELERTRHAFEASESKAHAFFESAAQAIVIVDVQGFVVMANRSTEKMFGYTVRELVGKPVDMLVPAHFQGSHQQHRDKYFEHPQMRPMGMGLDLQARRKDGSNLYVEISLSYIQSAEGTLAVALVTDVTKRRADEDAIRQQGQELRNLAGQLMSAQDSERRRIARDLHDDLSQHLAFLAMDLGRLATQPAAKELVTEIRPLQLRAAEIAETVRKISHQLHPSVLEDIGLEAALEQYCEEFRLRTGITAQFTSRALPESLPLEVSSSVYHIAQECLRNVAKHAHTDKVSVSVEFLNQVLRLTIRDQGVGLPSKRTEGSGIGLVAMRERARLVKGKLSIASGKGNGTQITVEVPVPDVSNQVET